MNRTTGLLVSAAMLVSSAAFAGTVFEKDIADNSNNNRHLKVEFKANTENPELGRAWIRAYYSESVTMDNDSAPPKAEDIAVPGLSYSASSNQIMYKGVVCADKSGSSFKPTGRCEITTSSTTLSQDNGFTVKKSPGIKISLNVKE